MPIVFSAALGHAPGIVAWQQAADPAQRDTLFAGFEQMRLAFEAAGVEQLVLLTSEHWTNFFLDHISPFCVGRGETFKGPVEPWLGLSPSTIEGAPALAAQLIEALHANDIDAGFAYELALDHGSMVPLHFLTPAMKVPIVPVFINTLAAPQPSPRRCAMLGRVLGDVLARSPLRIAVVATGGMSHDPGERNHGFIDEAFDRRFLEQMASGNLEQLCAYSLGDLMAAGAGAVELLAWIALAGALRSFHGEVIAYEAVKPWATGIGLMVLHANPVLSNHEES
jgi:hypothetical protein